MTKSHYQLDFSAGDYCEHERYAGVAIIGWSVAAIVIAAAATVCILYWRVHH